MSHLHRCYSPGLLRSKIVADFYLDGYWQSDRYFKDIESVVRSEFQVRGDFLKPHLDWVGRIRGCNSVAIHVRRAEYAPKCPAGYYHQAVDLIAGSGGGPHFFVFSDEPEWARTNLRLGYALTFITPDGPDTDVRDLLLMSMCSHFVIANSTFSWWAAWLGSNPDKRVIAPRHWWVRGNGPPKGLIPDSWKVI
jgi:hypothetical protein